MDDTERIAEQYLLSLGLGDPAFEPDGNVPPDFLLGGRIAIEVRRLNQYKTLPTGAIEPLDELSNPFVRNVEGYLPNFGASARGESWFVFLHFSRPLERWRKLRRKLANVLDSFKRGSNRLLDSYFFEVTSNFEIELWRARKPHSEFFLLGGSADEDSGGFVLVETTRSLTVCIPEKEAKVERFRCRYPEWWLVLVNYVGLALNADDLSSLRETQPVSHTWDKVILVNPLNPLIGAEI